ncbi:hypothetical protein CA54_60590 [Symmachiella macrocystis]|uniref:Uncharacterized protein n=1 Tax=Symmachiella macrocystis TaxID=2527985 RepID=A0A5C6AXE0_9PLAN|nr:hypothetical protein [Symmachiella macrocystis]TWU04177.1 hypothetical protein CA54_60590 [Symmachiella macrocystis]
MSSTTRQEIPSWIDEITDGRCRLVTWMQDVYFGRLENLLVRDGEPQEFPEPIQVFRRPIDNLRRCGCNKLTWSGPHPKALDNLWELFDIERNLWVEVIEVRNGLATHVTFRPLN